jgi:hypothetical protein
LSAWPLSNAGGTIFIAESARKFAFGDVIRGDEPLEVLGEQT